MALERPASEIGFVLAGAISAGCYTAGVMNFIIEALNDYDAERETRPGGTARRAMFTFQCWPVLRPAE
jgi:hypothetical protein